MENNKNIDEKDNLPKNDLENGTENKGIEENQDENKEVDFSKLTSEEIKAKINELAKQESTNIISKTRAKDKAKAKEDAIKEVEAEKARILAEKEELAKMKEALFAQVKKEKEELEFDSLIQKLGVDEKYVDFIKYDKGDLSLQEYIEKNPIYLKQKNILPKTSDDKNDISSDVLNKLGMSKEQFKIFKSKL